MSWIFEQKHQKCSYNAPFLKAYCDFFKIQKWECHLLTSRISMKSSNFSRIRCLAYWNVDYCVLNWISLTGWAVPSSGLARSDSSCWSIYLICFIHWAYLSFFYFSWIFLACMYLPGPYFQLGPSKSISSITKFKFGPKLALKLLSTPPNTTITTTKNFSPRRGYCRVLKFWMGF